MDPVGLRSHPRSSSRPITTCRPSTRSGRTCQGSPGSSRSRGGLDALREKGASVSDADLDARRAGLDRTILATIIYTSGTTGRPKGCQLNHGNFLDLAENAIEKLGDVVYSTMQPTLLFLPLAHVFARFIEVLCVAGRARMGHSPDIKTLLEDFAATFQPTFILAVPRIFEEIFNSSEAKASAEGKGKIFLHASDGGGRLQRVARLGRSRPPAPAAARSSTSSSTSSCAPRWAGASATPSPAARRSAPVSGTSTVASA